MTLSDRELGTVLAVFDSVMHRNDLNSWLGSLTIEEMSKLYHKLRYRGYCESHGITYEEMTEDDFMSAYFEEQEG